MSKFNMGDAVKILTGSKFVSGSEVPASLINTELYIVDVKANDVYAIGMSQNTKRAIGTIKEENLVEAEAATEGFDPYIILTTMETNTYIAPSYEASIKQTLPKGKLFTVIFEENGYGRLKNGRGWIDLDLVTKIS